MENFANYKITDHAKQRYAERVMGKEYRDAQAFVVSNQDKVIADIAKMLEFGSEIYEGKSISEYNKANVKVVLSGTWVLILDPARLTVITLYKIDLGLGEDFNKEYVKKMLDKFFEAKDNWEEVFHKNAERNGEFTQLMKNNETEIADYRKVIKSLEEQNAAYKTLIDESLTNNSIAEKEMRDILGTFIGRKTF